MNMSLIFRLVFRDWRAGELHLLLASLLVAVGTVTTITMTISRIESAMVLESASFLAADRVIDSGNPIPDSFYAAAREQGLTISEMMQFLFFLTTTVTDFLLIFTYLLNLLNLLLCNIQL